MKKAKRLTLFALFTVAALLIAAGGFLFSRLSPTQRILRAIDATAVQETQRIKALRGDYPVLARLGSLAFDSGETVCRISFSEIQNVPFAPLIGAMLKETGGALTILSNGDARQTDASLRMTLPGATELRAGLYSAPGMLCLSLPDFTDTVVSATPEQFGAQLQSEAVGSSLPMGELGALLALQFARPDSEALARLRQPLQKIGAQLLAKAKFSEPQAGLTRIEIGGADGPILALGALLEQEGVLSGDAAAALRGFCEAADSITLFAELAIPGETVTSARVTATAWKQGGEAAKLELIYDNDGIGGQSLSLALWDEAGKASRISLDTSATDGDATGRLLYSFSMEQSDGSTGSLSFSATADRADGLACSAYLSANGRGVNLDATGASLVAEGETLRLEAPSLRLRADALQKAELVYQAELTRRPFADQLSAPEATPLDSMNEQERQALFSAYRSGLKQTFGKMLGGLLF